MVDFIIFPYGDHGEVWGCLPFFQTYTFGDEKKYRKKDSIKQ